MKKDTAVFCSALLDVLKGRKLLKKIIKKYSLNMNMDFIVFIPKGVDDVTYFILLYLNKFIETLERKKTKAENNGFQVLRRNERFLVLTNDKIVLKSAKIICRRVSDVEFLSDKAMEEILSYYRIFPFSDRIIIGTIDGIPGRTGYRALKENGFSTEYLIANGIYHLEMEKITAKSRPTVPAYRGFDKDIQFFIESNDKRIHYE